MLPETGTMRCTVADVDMVGYSDVARMLEENTNAGSVSELNRQIQGFITSALRRLKSPGETRIIASTGDGGLLLFERAEDAHLFGCSLQQAAKQYSEQRNVPSAKRRFRIGIATGEVHLSSGGKQGDQYAGIAIANAVRLQTAASPSELLIDTVTFAALTPSSKKQYAPQEQVSGKREETFRAHRCAIGLEDAATPSAKSGSSLSQGSLATPWWKRRITISVSVGFAAIVLLALSPIFIRQPGLTGGNAAPTPSTSDTKPPDPSEFDSPKLVGTWEIASGDPGAAEVTLLELHADGTYKKTLNANVSNPSAPSNSFGGTHSGTWKSRGKIVYLSGDGHWPAYLQDLSKARKLN